MFIAIVQALESDWSFSSYYNVVSSNWGSGRFDPFFRSFGELGGCLDGTVAKLAPSFGCTLSSALSVATSALSSAVQLFIDVFNPAGSSFAQSWGDNLYGGFPDSIARFGDCAGDTLDAFGGRWRFGCVARTAASVASGAVSAAGQLACDLLLGGHFPASWVEGKYEPLFGALSDLAQCIGGAASLVNGDLACVLGSVLDIPESLARDAVGVALAIDDAVESGRNLGDSIMWALRNGTVTHAVGAIARTGWCADSLLAPYTAGGSCLANATANAVRSAFLTAMASVATALRAKNTAFGAALIEARDSGVFAPLEHAVGHMGECASIALSPLDAGLGCAAANAFYALAAALSDTVAVVASFSGGDGGAGAWGALHNATRSGAFNRTAGYAAGAAACLGAFVDRRVYGGLGTAAAGAFSAALFVAENAAAVGLMAAASDNYTAFAAGLYSDWNAGAYEAPFAALASAEAGVERMARVAPGSWPCLAGEATAGALRAVARDASRAAVLAAYSFSLDGPVQSALSYARADLLSPAGEDLKSTYNLLHGALPACLGSALGSGAAACLPGSALSAAAGLARAGAASALGAAADLLSGSSPLSSFCSAWGAPSGTGFVQDALGFASCAGNASAPLAQWAPCLVETVLKLVPLAAQDAGDLACAAGAGPGETLDVASVAPAFTEGWDAGGFQRAISELPAVSACAAAAIPAQWAGTRCAVSATGALAASAARAAVELSLLVAAAGVPLPAGLFPASQDTAVDRVLYRLRSSWEDGRLKGLIRALHNATLCAADAIAGFDAGLACAASGVLGAAAEAAYFAGGLVASLADWKLTSEPLGGELSAAIAGSPHAAAFFDDLDGASACLEEFMGEFSGEFACLLPSAIVAAASTADSALLLVSLILNSTYAGQPGFPQAFDAAWEAGSFNGTFDALEAFSGCAGGAAGVLNEDLGLALAYLADATVEAARSVIDLLYYVGVFGTDFAGMAGEMLSELDDPASGFLNPVFDYLVLFGGSLGDFFVILDDNVAALVSASVEFVVEAGRAGVRLLLTLTAGLMSPSHDPFPLIKQAWTYGPTPYNGGRFAPLFQAYQAASAATGGIVGYIDVPLGSLAGAALALPSLILLGDISTLMFVTDPSPLASVQGAWGAGMYDSYFFSPTAALFTYAGNFVSEFISLAGCLVGSLGGLAVRGVQFIASYAVFYNQIATVGPGPVVAIAPLATAMNSVGVCFQAFMYSLTGAQCISSPLNPQQMWCAAFSPDFFCYSGALACDLSVLLTDAYTNILVQYPTAIIAGGPADSVGGWLLLDLQALLLNLSYIAALLVPNPGTLCQTDSWHQDLGLLVYSVLNFLTLPVQYFGVMWTLSSDGNFMSSILNPVVGNVVALLTALAQLAVCSVSGQDAADFISTLATALTKLYTVYTDTMMYVMDDLVMLAVDLVTGNFSDFTETMSSFISTFGDIFISIVETVFDALIPGGVDAITKVVNFFTGSFCSGAETALNSVIGIINDIIDEIQSVCGSDCVGNIGSVDFGCTNDRKRSASGPPASKGLRWHGGARAPGWFRNTSFYDPSVVVDGFSRTGLGRREVNGTGVMSAIATMFDWNGTSVCDAMIAGYAEWEWQRVPFGDRLTMSDCVKKRTAMLLFAYKTGWYYAPQDLLYNWQRPVSLARDAYVAVVTYAGCVKSNLSCATSTPDLAAALEARGVDYPSAMFILGAGESALSVAVNFTAIDEVLSGLEGRSPASSLLAHTWQLLKETGRVLANSSSGLSDPAKAARGLRGMGAEVAAAAGRAPPLGTLGTLVRAGRWEEHGFPAAVGRVSDFIAKTNGKFARGAEALLEPENGLLARLAAAALDSRRDGACSRTNASAAAAWARAPMRHLLGAPGFARAAVEGAASSAEAALGGAVSAAGRAYREAAGFLSAAAYGAVSGWSWAQGDSEAPVGAPLYEPRMPRSSDFELHSGGATPPHAPFPPAERPARVPSETPSPATAAAPPHARVGAPIASARQSAPAAAPLPWMAKNYTAPALPIQRYTSRQKPAPAPPRERRAATAAFPPQAPGREPATPGTAAAERVASYAVAYARAYGDFWHGPPAPAGRAPAGAISLPPRPKGDLGLVYEAISAAALGTVALVTSTAAGNTSWSALSGPTFSARRAPPPAGSRAAFALPSGQETKGDRNARRARAVYDYAASRLRASGCPAGDPVCTGCAVADAFVSTVVGAIEDTVAYYSVTLPSKLSSYEAYSEMLQNGSRPGGTEFPDAPPFPSGFFTGLLSPLFKKDDEGQSDDGGPAGGSRVGQPGPLSDRANRPASTVYWVPDALEYLIPGILGLLDTGISSLSALGRDTAQFTVSPSREKALSGLATRLFVCDYSNLYTCSERNMSLAQGLLLTATVLVALWFVNVILPTTMFIAAAAILTFPLLMFVTYNSAFTCGVPPSCVMDDVMNFFSFTVFTPCLQWAGLIVPNEYYAAVPYEAAASEAKGSCPACGANATAISCAMDLGFDDFPMTLLFAAKMVPIKSALRPLSPLLGGAWDQLDDSVPVYEYLARWPPTSWFFGAPFMRRYYAMLSMLPGSTPSKRVFVREYVDTLFSPDGGDVPPMYFACFALSVFNLSPIALMYGFAHTAFSLLVLIGSWLVGVVAVVACGVALMHGVISSITVFVEERDRRWRSTHPSDHEEAAPHPVEDENEDVGTKKLL